MGRNGQRGATVLTLVVLLSWLVAAVLAAVGVAPRAQAPPVEPASGAGPVVVVGVPELTWDQVDTGTDDGVDDPSATVIAGLAARGGTAALVLRGTHETTCAADAWLTLGAGQRAATDVAGCVDAGPAAGAGGDGTGQVLPEELVEPRGRGAVVDADAWGRWTALADRRSLGTELGTLAELLSPTGCVAAYDPLSALGAADADGRVEAYRPRTDGGGRGSAGPSSPELVPGCDVHLVSTDPADPGAVGDLVDGLPGDATVVLAGMGHLQDEPAATVLVVAPAGSTSGGALTSGSTQQRSLVQLTDLTATVLHLAGVEGPFPDAVAGQPVVVVEDDPDGGEGARSDPDGKVRTTNVEQARDLAAGITLAKTGAPWVLGGAAAVLLVLLLAAVVVRRVRPGSTSGTWGLSVVATAVLSLPVATFLAGLVPWWSAARPVLALSVVVLATVGLLTFLAWVGPWRRHPLGPAAVLAAVTLAVVGVDVLWSARLGLVSVLGLQPVTAGRFYGQGNVGFGIVLGAYLVLSAAVVGPGTDLRAGSRPARPAPPERPSRSGRTAAAVVLTLGAAAVVLNAAPQGGADFGGVPALVVATGLMTLAALEVRWSARALLLLGLAGVLVAAAVMLLDWTRGPGRRTHLGDFVQRILDGTALEVVGRKLEQSLGILLAYPLSWLAVLALVLLAVALVRRPGWAAPVWKHTGLRAALAAGVVAAALGWVLNDSGIAVLALALTVLLAAALSVAGRPVLPGPGRLSRPHPSR
ncbi:hypothetical protein [Ornithinimicrobium kibberense]|uniref:Uncharacterized protein n=1 Tax=Ornithinimicrobium kibberense TaxID=282060 RepID=A0ABV5V2E5_9MICO|nr:hypothetical protein [Ornithinimicrobium kibberense]